MGCRRLWVLLSGLPADAAVWRDDTRWTQAHELSARQIEATDYAGRLVAASVIQSITGKPPKRMPDPVRIFHPDRPGMQQEKREVVSDPDEIGRWFGTKLAGR